VFLDPSNVQKSALEDLLSEVPEIDAEDRLDEAIRRALLRPLDQSGLTFEEVEPYLGDQLSLFALWGAGEQDPFEWAAVIMLEGDTSRLAGSIQRRDLGAVIEQDMLVAGTPGAVDSFGSDRGLASSERFLRATDGLPPDRIGRLYLSDPGALGELGTLGGSPIVPLLLGMLSTDAVGAHVYVEKDSLVVESTDREPLRFGADALKSWIDAAG
jgi:hypothetical protein